ncbi:uncharacterized protein LOC129569274 isoform X2 [Sitodiplosis mosellana]|uniref:uncharacterized protein LOC129569274 isoform X2 n=1 Tax=Sitodiplosis mosellana TaxID=263140 RepID=UPI0024440C66|nr:uncharacterized protein LOC129569274 isoform X2 [Sitodiplosis mosellana]
MNLLKSMYRAFNREDMEDITNNAIQLKWMTPYTHVQCLWKIYPVLKQFGEIKNMGTLLSSYGRIAFVEFTTHQEAISVLLKRQITIGNCKIELKPLKGAFLKYYCPVEISQRVKVDDILLLNPPDRESPKNILNILNDDCLYEIFRRIHPSKYHIIADVCVKFNQILTEMLERKHHKNMFDISDMELFTLSEADHYLQHFGSSIYRAEISGFKLKPHPINLKIKIILKMISEHCVNLRDFRIINFELEKETANQIIPLFTRIEKLTIQKTTASALFPVFLPPINCPKLVEFYWSNKYISTYTKQIQIPFLINFLKHNTQLKKFWYFGNVRHGLKDNKMHLPMNISLFGRFKFLKSLSITNHESFIGEHSIDEHLLNVTNLMQILSMENIPIEYLKLDNVLVDDASIEYIFQLKTMKQFVFSDFNCYLPMKHSPTRDVIESYIIRLQSGLPNLEFLQFQTSSYIDIVFTDENTDQTEKHLQKKIITEIKLNLQQFNSSAFTDKYNYTTIENTTYRKRTYNIHHVPWYYRLTIRKFPAVDSEVQRYWLTLSYRDDLCAHIPVIGFPFE